jgi:hypothetical protein
LSLKIDFKQHLIFSFYGLEIDFNKFKITVFKKNETTKVCVVVTHGKN